jgi:uncharacterized membrane protein (DUF4010 family)
MTFALITCIILPILPNTTYKLVPPLNVLNPFEIWTMVVLMVGISLGGYLTYKFLGRTAGVLLGGLLGGAISSTATTVTYARRSGESEDSSRLATVVVAIASAVVYLRVIVEIASALTAAIAWLRIRHAAEEMPEQRNPTELKSALAFASLYAGVLLALTAAKTYLGGQGLYGVAVLSGLTDMDAITLSVSRLVGLDPQRGGIEPAQAWRLIVLATMANLLFKWTMCLLIGRRRFAWEIGALFAMPLIAGGLLLWLWP